MKLGIILFFSILTAAAMAAPAAAVLKVKSYLKIDGGEKIFLHQLVDGAADLPKIVLGSAPALGERRIFTSKAIAQALRSHTSFKQSNLVIPNQVVVENRGYELSEEAIHNELKARWSSLCAECSIEIRTLQIPILPSESKNRPWAIENDARLPKGSFTQKLLVTQPSGQKSIFWVNGEMAVRKLVPVATRALNFGQRLSEEDFRWEMRDVTQATDGLPNENAIAGQKLKLPVQVGGILFSGMIEREKAVHRGEVVQVSVRGEEGWQVTLEAVTEQDGYIGDRVNVKNRQTNKIVSAQVVARGKVAVE